MAISKGAIRFCLRIGLLIVFGFGAAPEECIGHDWKITQWKVFNAEAALQVTEKPAIGIPVFNDALNIQVSESAIDFGQVGLAQDVRLVYFLAAHFESFRDPDASHFDVGRDVWNCNVGIDGWQCRECHWRQDKIRINNVGRTLPMVLDAEPQDDLFAGNQSSNESKLSTARFARSLLMNVSACMRPMKAKTPVNTPTTLLHRSIPSSPRVVFRLFGNGRGMVWCLEYRFLGWVARLALGHQRAWLERVGDIGARPMKRNGSGRRSIFRMPTYRAQ
jgi:hypothetical protein